MRAALTRVLLQGFRADWLRELKRLEADQWLPEAVIAGRARDGLTATLRHACAQVPFYRQWCAEAGLGPAVVSAADLPAFPLLTKQDLTDRQERFLADDAPAAESLSWATGGSSGVWFRFQRDRRTFAVRTANGLRGATWAGWRLGEKQAVLWGHPRDNKAIHSRRQRVLAAVVHRSLNLNAYDMDDAILADYAARLRAWRPVLIRGYASSLSFLADYILRHGIAVPSPRGIISSAETLTEAQRAGIERCFGCKVLNRYGSREFADIAQQCEQVGGLHVFSDRLHLEILRPDGTPCAPGERGEIVITDLENRVMPFVRYRTGDLARSQEEPCPCGRGLPLLAAVEGRTSELIVGRNGKYYTFSSPYLFGAGTPGIAQMQLVQKSRQEIEIRVVPGRAWGEESRRQLEVRIHELLGPMDLRITTVERIAPAPSGKTPFVIGMAASGASWESTS